MSSPFMLLDEDDDRGKVGEVGGTKDDNLEADNAACRLGKNGCRSKERSWCVSDNNNDAEFGILVDGGCSLAVLISFIKCAAEWRDCW